MRLSFAATAFALALTLGPAPAKAAAWPWLDPSLPLSTRLNALLAKLSMPQKLNLMHGTVGPYDGYIPGIPELGVPSLDLADGSAGIRSSFTSSALPMALGLAATWNRALAAEYGETLGRDARALGVNALFGPMVNIVRVPAGGRNFESLGEDPYLAAGMVVPEVESLQGQGVIAVVKHYAVNNQQNGQHRDSMDVDARTFHEIYLPAFAAAVREAHAGGIMCAYNQVNSSWSCENKPLYDVLRKELGFEGFVVSDFYAQHDIYRSIFNGLDLEMPVGAIYGPYLTQAVEHGNVKPTLIDEHIGRTLGSMLRVGAFDHPPSKSPIPAERDLAVARRVAGEGAVLLRNDGNLLPLDPSRVHSIALIGPNIEPAPTFGGGSSRVETPRGAASPLSAIRAALGPSATVGYAYAQAVPFMDDLPTVDSLALSPPSGNGHGLLGEYFASLDLSGTPTQTRVDQSVAFDLHHLGIDSARWTGTLRVPAGGVYAIGAEGACACRLVVGTTTLLDGWGRAGNAPAVKPSPITLQPGTAYPIVFTWHRGGDNFARLEWEPPATAPEPDIQHAAAVAKSAQVAVVFAGDFETEGRDRTTLALMGRQNELIEAVAAANPRTVVVLNTGSAILMDPWLTSVRSVLEMWYPGEAAGLASADLLFGATNPSGKLPISFPAREDAVPATVAYGPEPAEGQARSVPYVERLDVGYRWYDARNVAPLFPFGFGLSYTTFAFANLQVTPRSGNAFSASVDVTNSGQRAGSEVVQLYVSDPVALGEPLRQLRAFEKVALAPGETKHVTLQIPRQAFAVWEEPGGWRVHGGSYTLSVGSSSRDLPLAQTIEVSG